MTTTARVAAVAVASPQDHARNHEPRRIGEPAKRGDIDHDIHNGPPSKVSISIHCSFALVGDGRPAFGSALASSAVARDRGRLNQVNSAHSACVILASTNPMASPSRTAVPQIRQRIQRPLRRR
jgi:hypothetical protein